MKPLRLLLLLCVCALSAHAEVALHRWELEVNGVKRTALVYVPPNAGTLAKPVVFAFHGHGGTSERAHRMFALDRHWPEAISVYMQGLNTPGRLSDPEGKRPGWQHAAGEQGDRDLHFFDAVLARLKREHHADEKRVFACGNSNGGAFTYMLWAERGDALAAVAPSGCVAVAANRPKLKPKPAMHIAGRNDPLVKYEWQAATIEFLKQLNSCTGEGEPWAPYATRWNPARGATFIAAVYPAEHRLPEAAPPLIARFFREISK